jgi:thioredoxin 2
MKVVCPKCSILNNVSLDQTREKKPVCGKCRAELEPDAPGYPVNVADSSFTAIVSNSKKPVLLDLWGPSCPPCRQLAPILKELAKKYAGRLKVAKLNVEEHGAVAGRFQIKGIPTLLLFVSGKEVSRTVGFQTLAQLEAFVARAL